MAGPIGHNAAMTDTGAAATHGDHSAPADAPRTGTARSIVAVVCGVLGVLLLTLAVVGVWARATVFERDNFTDLVSAGLEEPAAQADLAAYATAQLFEVVDVVAVMGDVLPRSLQRLTPTLVGGAEAAVQQALERAIATPAGQQFLTDSVGRAHDSAMRLLQGDGLGDGVTLADGTVTLNLLPLVGLGLEALQERGLLEGVRVPDLSVDGDPDEQRSVLARALGRRLPDDFGQLVVLDSKRLADAQASVERTRDVLVLAKRGLWLAIVLAVVFPAAAVALAPHRWRALLFLGVGTAASMSLLRVATRQLAADAPNLAQRPGVREAIEAVLAAASSSLLRVAGVVMVVAVIGTIVGMARRGWPRADFVLLAAVVVGTAIVALVGITVVSLVVGVLAGVAVPVVDRLLLAPGAAGATRPAGGSG